jgi:hypothetical protein
MPSYMEGYGQTDQRRGRVLKRILGIGVPVILLAVASYFYFRTWSQERAVSAFLESLEAKKYEEAYGMWCNAAHPCPYYPLARFREDWGPEGQFRDLSKMQWGSVDYCGQGVVFEAAYPGAEPFGLWVERSTNVIGFAPYARCPGKHLQLGAFFRRIFG